MKRSNLLLFFPLLLSMPGFALPVCAEPLYVQLVKSAEPDAEQLKKAETQIRERKEITLAENLFVSPFHKHKRPEQNSKAPVCQHCHLDLPHRKNIQQRSFLNMHTRYIACETCHFKPEAYALSYQWQTYSLSSNEDIEIPKNRKQTLKKLSEEYPGKRITPYYKGKPVTIFSDHPYAENIKSQWKIKTNSEKAYLKAQLHHFLKKKGPACADCHTKESPFIDLKKLGAEQQQIHHFLTNPIPNFFSRFKSDEERLRITDLLQ